MSNPTEPKAKAPALDNTLAVVNPRPKPKPEVQDVEPGLFDKITGAFSGPTADRIINTNKRNAIDAAKLTVGEAVLSRIRESIIKQLLPEASREVLDSPGVSQFVDLALANVLLYGMTVFGDKLPPQMAEVGFILADCMDRAAYHRTFGLVNFENILKNVLSGEIADMVSSLRKANA
jgi:hypothetical protein